MKTCSSPPSPNLLVPQLLLSQLLNVPELFAPPLLLSQLLAPLLRRAADAAAPSSAPRSAPCSSQPLPFLRSLQRSPLLTATAPSSAPRSATCPSQVLPLPPLLAAHPGPQLLRATAPFRTPHSSSPLLIAPPRFTQCTPLPFAAPPDLLLAPKLLPLESHHAPSSTARSSRCSFSRPKTPTAPTHLKMMMSHGLSTFLRLSTARRGCVLLRISTEPTELGCQCNRKGACWKQEDSGRREEENRAGVNDL